MGKPKPGDPWEFADIWMVLVAPFCVGGLLTAGLSQIWKPLEYSFFPLYIIGVGVVIWLRVGGWKR